MFDLRMKNVIDYDVRYASIFFREVHELSTVLYSMVSEFSEINSDGS